VEVPADKGDTTPIPVVTTPVSTTSTNTPVVVAPTITPENLALLNPNNLPYSINSPTSIDVLINGVYYTIDLTNYQSFYSALDASNINTLAKYLTNISNKSEEIEYTIYTPTQYYELDSRGYVTINIPFNGKVVTTVKYTTDNSNLIETNYLHTNYLGTPTLLTNTNGIITNVITRDSYGKIQTNLYNSNLT
jgi:uncharacterized beta-barrel protein YwiB (DUF1934 family)